MGRVLRKKWTAPWRVLPSLENWIQFFKNNESNFQNEQFYNLDYLKVGNLYEKQKLIYPNDNSIINCDKIQYSDKVLYRYKVIKENMLFGLRDSQDLSKNPYSEFWLHFQDTQARLLVDFDSDEQARFYGDLKA